MTPCSVATWHRSTVPNSKNSKNSNFYKDQIQNIQTIIQFDFMLIMIIVLILILLNIIISITILFQLNCIVHYWINTHSTHITIDLILTTIIFKIGNVIKLICIQMIYVLILNKLRTKSNLKMKINENNCKLSCDSKCNTMCQLPLTQVTLHMSFVARCNCSVCQIFIFLFI